MEDTILTFTTHDMHFIQTHGCDESWVLNTARAGMCKYLVCCHSQGANKGAAFCVGLISRLRPVPTETGKERYAIHLSAYTRVDIPGVWQGWRNPVRYITLTELGIDPATLEFVQFEPPKLAPFKVESLQPSQEDDIPPLSIQQAKEGIAKKFNLSPDQIEIIIKG